jgi:C4-dicarboxylate-specific signal transduction histidine kinase
MAAMRGHAELSYGPLFVALSLVIAIGASTVALWLAFRTTDLGQKLVAAVVMGLAISGMHYTAMRAAIFTANGPVHEAQVNASRDQTNLALAVAGITFIILACASVASLFERKRAEDALRQAQMDLARVTRLITLGELTASIAHEINQPLAGVVSSGNACLRWLAHQPPELEKARLSVERLIKDGNRASEVILRVRALVKGAPQRKTWWNINETILEVIALTRSEAQRSGVSIETHLSSDLPPVLGDRIQLQQVILNLLVNAIEAMSEVDEPRELLVGSRKHESNSVLVAVRDSGTGLDLGSLDHVFDAFYTTKPDGMGMGLAICRSIIEAHGGRLWATPNDPRGAVFQFSVPTRQEEAS